jgi:conjugal transfer ATP-binding protein TraC
MNVLELENSYLGEFALSQRLWPLSYEEEKQFYYLECPGNEKRKDKLAYLGFAFECMPLAGYDEKTIAKLQALFTQPFPTGSYIQFMLYKSPDLDGYCDNMLALREREPHVPPLLKEMILSRAEFIRAGTKQSISSAAKGYIHDTVLTINVKVPLEAGYGEPSERDLANVRELQVGVKQVLETCSLRTRNLDPNLLLRFCGTFLGWDSQASWRGDANLWDRNMVLRDQMKDANVPIKVHKSHLKIGDTFVKMLTPRRLPEEHSFGVNGELFGDPISGKGIPQNVIYSLLMHFPDTTDTKAAIAKKHAATKYQAIGPIMKWFPEIGERLDALDIMQHALSKGDRPVQIFPAFFLFTQSADEMTAATSNFKTYFRERGWIMMDDMFIQSTILANHMPFCADPKAHSFLGRYGTVAARHAVEFLPVLSEWKGSGTAVMSLFSRNNHIMGLDFYDSNTNYNGVIAAASGSGKSFLSNEIICSYLSLGAQMFVIDVGRSYKNLCEELGGQFIEFTEDSNVCLNPFSFVEDFDEDCEALIGTMVAMAQENDPLSDPQLAALRIVITEVWTEHGRAAEVDHVAEKLKGNPDQRVSDIGNQLFPFTSRGPYGKWFRGQASVDFSNAFTVLELEELKAKPPLQRVVLLMLISQIQYAMYLGDISRRKFLIIDEAWELLAHPSIAKFIEGGYRKFRKYAGSALVITQNINDLYGSASGRAIADNSAFKLLLGQNAEAIESVRKEGRLAIGDWGFETLKTVHTLKGEYSEIFIYYQDGMGIGRLIVPPFNRILYSTAPDDRRDVAAKRREGLSLGDAIKAVARSRWGF